MPAPIQNVVVAGVLALGLGACSSGHPTAAPSESTTPTAPTTAAPTTSRPAPQTTVYHPSAPQSSADAAASLLVADWSQGNRAAAANVGTPAAVSALFAVAYPGGALALDRGCGDTPEVCTYGPNGGANPNDAIYEIFVSQTSGGWYVTSVTVET